MHPAFTYASGLSPTPTDDFCNPNANALAPIESSRAALASEHSVAYRVALAVSVALASS